MTPSPPAFTSKSMICRKTFSSTSPRSSKGVGRGMTVPPIAAMDFSSKTEMSLALSFFAIQTERLQNRRVVHGKENRVVLGRAVGVLVPVPQRHDERVAFLPVERL